MTAKKAVAKAQASGKAQEHAVPAKPVSKSARMKTSDLATVLSADRVTISRGREQVELPGDVVSALRRYATELAGGGKPRLVAVTEDKATLSSQQAADMLNVSRPFFIGLLDNGSIPYHLVGRHRRVRAEELFRYMEMRSIERDAAMKELIQSDFEDGLI